MCLLSLSSPSLTILLSSPPSYLYQIAHLGDDDEEPEFSSAMPLEEGETFFFAPRPLKNLVLVDELESLSPIMSAHVSVIAEVLVVHYEVYLNGCRSQTWPMRTPRSCTWHVGVVPGPHSVSCDMDWRYAPSPSRRRHRLHTLSFPRLRRWQCPSCQATLMRYGQSRPMQQVTYLSPHTAFCGKFLENLVISPKLF